MTSPLDPSDRVDRIVASGEAFKPLFEALAEAITSHGTDAMRRRLDRLVVMADTYFTNFAGSPDWVNKNNVGMMMGGWQPDWNDGYGMMDQVITKDGVKAAGGGTNLSQFSNPDVEALFAKASSTSDGATVFGSARLRNSAGIFTAARALRMLSK